MVMSEGRVVESGHPHTLLQNFARFESLSTFHGREGGEGGGAVRRQGGNEAVATFSSMVDETGPASSELLRRLAKEAWEASAQGAATNRMPDFCLE